MVLAYHQARDGVASPSVGTIAEKAGVSDRTVIRSLKRLESLGYLVVERRYNDTSVYRLWPRDGRAEGSVKKP
jgi:DNA-binding MarR family transcriptional regulator